MHLFGSVLRLSPSDLSAFLECRHRTGLELSVALGELDRPSADDPVADALRERGARHEHDYVEHLRAQGLHVVDVSAPHTAERIAKTQAAMRQGADVIVQAALSDQRWFGYADVLRRVDAPGSFGAWSYEPYDTKLARETRGGTILQLAVYVDLLGAIQGTRPERFHVVSPGRDGDPFVLSSYRYDDFAAYVRSVRRQLESILTLGADEIRQQHYPEPVEHCDVCRWLDRCHARRRRDDHLSFIAGIGRLHRDELQTHAVTTLAAAAALPDPLPFTPVRGSRETYARLREQARVQHEQRITGRPVYERLEHLATLGLARLPEPSDADAFLDLEGSRFAREGGREYLFGLWTAHDGYRARWAFTDAEEKAAFEATMDDLSRVAARPGAHIYHFGPYEPSALKRLMGRYATRAQELDVLLRAERFIDLYGIVRQAIRAGVERYSLKQLEPFYGFARTMPLREAVDHLQTGELALDGGVPDAVPHAAREGVLRYNADDCRSAGALRDWLEALRRGLVDQGVSIERPVPQDGEPNERVGELETRQLAMRAQLLDRVPAEAADATHPDHPRWLLAYLIDWHRREQKSEWWEYYRLRDLSDDDLLDESRAIAGLRHLERRHTEHYKNGKVKSVVDRYEYPPQEAELPRGTPLKMRGGESIGELVAHDRAERSIDIRKSGARVELHPSAVFEHAIVNTDVQQESLLRLAAEPDAITCGTDLLFRRTPRLSDGAFEDCEGETIVTRAVALATRLDRTTLAIQGPPGAGKTYAGAQMIRALVHAGRRVGVTAQSHKVIRNLLEEVLEQERASYVGQGADTPGHGATGGRVRVGHKCDKTDEAGEPAPDAVTEFDDNKLALAALASGDIHVLGGTAWLWAREEAAHAVDVLFIDEAGQLSLANALAVSRAAGSLVLLGDPQQLEQPQKGTHPDGVGVSALEHVLGGAATMPADRGLFLATTWRLHPDVCTFTSELFYDAKLQPKPGLERQRLSGTRQFDGAGLWLVTVPHSGNQNASPEEVEVVARIVERLLGGEWVDEKGIHAPLAASDLRIVAPYNAQVTRLAERLGPLGVPVGTVDKFQGQEAPAAIYSMTTSTPEDAPRGMEFLYSLNRLNVATSRARCAAIIVASDSLLEPRCRTPRQMHLANALCRFAELATRVDADLLRLPADTGLRGHAQPSLF